MASILLLLVLAFPLPQEGGPPPLPPGVVARINGRDITREKYLEYLWQRFSKRAVRELASDLLIEEEARRYGIELDEAAVAQAVEEREQAARSAPRPVSFEQELERSGQSIESFRATVAAEARRDQLLAKLVRATRVVTDQRLNQEFEAQYGLDGIKLRVRHILLMPNVLKAEQIKAGVRPDRIDVEQLKTEARRLAEEARARVASGADFAEVAAEVSHDQVTKAKGGELAFYDGRLYGPAFREAVLALRPGGVSEVVETGAGFHVVQLLERTQTRLEEVREALIQQILDMEPTWQEKQGLLQALQNAAELQLW